VRPAPSPWNFVSGPVTQTARASGLHSGGRNKQTGKQIQPMCVAQFTTMHKQQTGNKFMIRTRPLSPSDTDPRKKPCRADLPEAVDAPPANAPVVRMLAVERPAAAALSDLPREIRSAIVRQLPQSERLPYYLTSRSAASMGRGLLKNDPPWSLFFDSEPFHRDKETASTESKYASDLLTLVELRPINDVRHARDVRIFGTKAHSKTASDLIDCAQSLLGWIENDAGLSTDRVGLLIDRVLRCVFLIETPVNTEAVFDSAAMQIDSHNRRKIAFDLLDQCFLCIKNVVSKFNDKEFLFPILGNFLARPDTAMRAALWKKIQYSDSKFLYGVMTGWLVVAGEQAETPQLLAEAKTYWKSTPLLTCRIDLLPAGEQAALLRRFLIALNRWACPETALEMADFLLELKDIPEGSTIGHFHEELLLAFLHLLQSASLPTEGLNEAQRRETRNAFEKSCAGKLDGFLKKLGKKEAIERDSLLFLMAVHFSLYSYDNLPKSYPKRVQHTLSINPVSSSEKKRILQIFMRDHYVPTLGLNRWDERICRKYYGSILEFSKKLSEADRAEFWLHNEPALLRNHDPNYESYNRFIDKIITSVNDASQDYRRLLAMRGRIIVHQFLNPTYYRNKKDSTVFYKTNMTKDFSKLLKTCRSHGSELYSFVLKSCMQALMNVDGYDTNAVHTLFWKRLCELPEKDRKELQPLLSELQISASRRLEEQTARLLNQLQEEPIL
jgi:hypothetical protein